MVEDLDAEDGGLAGAHETELRGLGEHAHRLEHDVVGVQEQEERHEADESGMALVLLGHGARNARAEQHGQIVHDEHKAVVDHLAADGEHGKLQERNGSHDGLVGEEDTQDQHGARHGKIHQRLHDGLGKHLQRALQICHYPKLLSSCPRSTRRRMGPLALRRVRH